MTTDLLAGALSLAGLLCAAGAGMWLHGNVRAEWRDAPTKDGARFVMTMLSTLTGVLISLLISTGKTSFDREREAVGRLAASMQYLDMLLVEYGPDAAPARTTLAHALPPLLATVWPDQAQGQIGLGKAGATLAAIKALPVRTAAQQELHPRLLAVASELTRERFQLLNRRSFTTPRLLIAPLLLWVMVLFFGLGFCAPRHRVMLLFIGLLALAVSAAIFLIIGLEYPFDPPIRVSPAPLLALQPLMAP